MDSHCSESCGGIAVAAEIDWRQSQDGCENNLEPSDSLRPHSAGASGEVVVDDRLDAKVHVGRAQSPRARATAKELHDLLIRQGFRCALTGRALTPDTAALDHKLSRSLGGGDDAANLQWLHDEANRAKGTLTTEAFIALCRDVVAFANRL